VVATSVSYKAARTVPGKSLSDKKTLLIGRESRFYEIQIARLQKRQVNLVFAAKVYPVHSAASCVLKKIYAVYRAGRRL